MTMHFQAVTNTDEIVSLIREKQRRQRKQRGAKVGVVWGKGKSGEGPGWRIAPLSDLKSYENDAAKWVGVYDMSSTDDQIAEDLKAWFAEQGMLV